MRFTRISDLPGRLISDDSDRAIFYERGRFWAERSLQYRNVSSEYPPLGTLAIGVYVKWVPRHTLSALSGSPFAKPPLKQDGAACRRVHRGE